MSTIDAFESNVLDMKEFYFTGDDYRYRIEIDAKRHFLELLKDQFNSGVRYKGKTWKWDTVILNKTQELRKRILELTQGEAKELRIGRSTLHYLRRNARNDTPFKVYQKVSHRLE